MIRCAAEGGRVCSASSWMWRGTIRVCEAPEPAVVGAGDFDPADHAAFAEIAEFVFGGPPRGQ